MHELTGKEIEKRAVMELITYFESQIDNVIIQSVKELEQLNGLKKIQGMHQKSRIDQECVQCAIKIINASEYTPQSEKTGGISPKKEKKIEKHSQKEEILTEVT